MREYTPNSQEVWEGYWRGIDPHLGNRGQQYRAYREAKAGFERWLHALPPQSDDRFPRVTSGDSLILERWGE